MKTQISIGLIAVYALSASGAETLTPSSSGSPAATQRVEMEQADNLVQRKILKELKRSPNLGEDTKKNIEVKVMGNIVYLDGPLNSVEEKNTILQIVKIQGPKYKVTDKTVTKQ